MRLRRHRRTEVMFPDDPSRLSPRVSTSFLPSPSLAVALPSCPAFPLSRRVLFAPHPSPVPLLTLSLSFLSLFLPLAALCFPPFSQSPFFAFSFRARADAIQSFREARAIGVAHLDGDFPSSARSALPARARIRRAFRLSLPRAGEGEGGGLLLHRTYVRNVNVPGGLDTLVYVRVSRFSRALPSLARFHQPVS